MTPKGLEGIVGRRMRSRAHLFVLSGPSGCGKTTLCSRLLKKRLGLIRSVSVTTREKRGREKDKRDYIYLSVPEFKRRLAKGMFLEHARVFGCYYATPKKFIEENLRMGRDVLLNIDVQGAAQIKRKFREAVLIFIVPPSITALKERLEKRSSDTPAQIRKRLTIARSELRTIGMYDYAVVNDCIDTAAEKLRAIITAARHELKRRNR